MFQFAQSLEHENLKVILPSFLTKLFFKELKEKIDLMLSFCATRDVTMSPERMEDWNVEESRIKTRASNCAIAMGELYVANMMDREQILEAIDILLEKPRLSCETVEITMKVLEKIGATLEKYDGTNLEKMFIYLRNLMDGDENVIEPDNVRMKFLYYDLLDLRRSGWMELEKKVVPTAEPAPNQGKYNKISF